LVRAVAQNARPVPEPVDHDQDRRAGTKPGGSAGKCLTLVLSALGID
jgi:hypothetical protein